MKLNLEGKTALITGGSKGIGKSIKEHLEEEKVKVTSVSRSEGYDLMTSIGIQKVENMILENNYDILINNVGGVGRGEDDLMTYQHSMQKNWFNTSIFTRAYLQNKNKNDFGRIITIASIYGKEAGGKPWFTSAKAAQIAYSKEIAKICQYSNITSNVISPGEIDVGKVDRKWYFGDPEDVANLATFLCSDKAKHINGANIIVDGGASYSF